ncbi:hypothetical protein Ferp_0340 [Ferroglobus placidus DSM 10642]|uniref:Lipoprotein n=1 Tax=Ferroglobus placidus (strain DSM 10642 / AEDII12DO) TaxID=589924 RepID=D3S2I9_FERPA|nr:hypothetical protein [Ferroglobus placidus]ADC64519.1 hypothetical protein Ferp_0340 [Ferroglobus placidus DSM 10642]
MKKILLLFFLLFAILVAGCFQSGEVKSGAESNQSKSESYQNHKSENNTLTAEEIAERIENYPEEFLSPYDGFSYTEVNVSVEGEKIIVKAKSNDLPGEDIYLFVFENGSLTLKSYLLEALPLSVKEKAISVALSNETIYENAKGHVTVRRVLPHTAAKFYIPKELFSVTWHSDRVVSALVDLDENRVVRIYVS